MSVPQLYRAACSAALGAQIIGSPDTAYLIKSTYTFNASHSLATVLASRSVDGTSTVIAPITPAGSLTHAGFPTAFTESDLTFSAITSPDIGAILIANNAASEPLVLLPLAGGPYALANQDLVVAVTGVLLEVHT